MFTGLLILVVVVRGLSIFVELQHIFESVKSRLQGRMRWLESPVSYLMNLSDVHYLFCGPLLAWHVLRVLVFLFYSMTYNVNSTLPSFYCRQIWRKPWHLTMAWWQTRRGRQIVMEVRWW